MNDYRQRNETLRRLGLGDYRNYLDSELWKSIRARVMKRDRFKCCVCRNKFHCVHHHDYDPATLLGKSIDRLFSLCEEHHKAVEFSENGRKRKFAEVREELRRLFGGSIPEEKISAREVFGRERSEKNEAKRLRRKKRRAKIAADPVLKQKERERRNRRDAIRYAKDELLNAEAIRMIALTEAERVAEFATMSKQRIGGIRKRMRWLRRSPNEVPHGQHGEEKRSRDNADIRDDASHVNGYRKADR